MSQLTKHKTKHLRTNILSMAFSFPITKLYQEEQGRHNSNRVESTGNTIINNVLTNSTATIKWERNVYPTIIESFKLTL